MPLMSVLLFASILIMIASNSNWVIRLNDRGGHSGLSKSSGWRVVGLTKFAIFLLASVKNWLNSSAFSNLSFVIFPFDSIWFIEVQLVFPVVKVFRVSQSFFLIFFIDGQLICEVQFIASSD